MSRNPCFTRKVETEFGSCYLHLDLAPDGRPVGASISSPGKEPNSQIAKLISALSEALDKALKEVRP